VHDGPLGQRDLGGQVGGGAEPVDAEPTARRQVGAAQRPVADDPRATKDAPSKTKNLQTVKKKDSEKRSEGKFVKLFGLR
jgi:hypothetical protein